MKKAVLVISLFFLALHLQAQDTLLLNRIKEAASDISTFEAKLHCDNKKGNKVSTKDGTMTYILPDKLAAVFYNGKHMIFNENYVNADIGIFHGTFRMRKGPIRSLSKALLYAIQGRCQDLADEQNYNLETATDDSFHTVTFTWKKKIVVGIGLKQAILRYDINSLRIKELVIMDNLGHIDTYTLSEEQYNIQTDESIFDF